MQMKYKNWLMEDKLNQPQNLSELKLQLQPVVDFCDMNVGTIRVIIMNRFVRSIIPSYGDVTERIPRGKTSQDFEEIRKQIQPFIGFINMYYGELLIIVNNHKIYDLKIEFSYKDGN